MNKGRTAIALRGAAAMFVFMVGCGAAVGAQRNAPTTDTPATSALSSEMPAPPGDPGGLTGGGALPVVPARLAPLRSPVAALSASTVGASVVSLAPALSRTTSPLPLMAICRMMLPLPRPRSR